MTLPPNLYETSSGIFGNYSVGIRTGQRWFQRFRSENESLQNEPRRRPKSVIRHDKLNALVKRNPRTVRKIGSDLQTSPATASRHLKKIGKVKMMDKFVPHQLNEIQRNRRITPRLLNRDGPILLHDNARSHTSQRTVHKLQRRNYEILAHLPYSPDISPTDYHIFKYFELAIRNKTFLNKEEIIVVFEQFASIKDDKLFEDGIYALEECSDEGHK
ncbi:histone-lysine N-methyltransferase SETMAR-like [Octopus sinensis]|uniref:Histone-lysine N-methyltransferase SETMAR-like n=1 Tax=Octopus sinensis TaxID=2607531 RepID=A0A7E6EZL9_9MOLL|nr:histone-lysine N-methyltransferase SETMAR-like [Octopus sinensis]